MFGKKKKDLSVLIQELIESKPKKTQIETSITEDRKSTSISLRDVKVNIEVSKMDELVNEVRELKIAIKELVDLIKSRVESEEQSETEKQQS